MKSCFIVVFALTVSALLSACRGQLFPRPTLSPQPTWTPAPTRTLVPVSHTACDHPFFPIRDSASWSFTISEESKNTPSATPPSPKWAEWEMWGLEGDASQANAKFQIGTDLTNETQATWLSGNVRCDTQNGLYPPSYMVTNLCLLEPCLLGTVFNMFFLFLPPAEKLVVGHSWPGFLIQHHRLGESTCSFDQYADVAYSFFVIGNDPVTLNGRTYDGVEIRLDSAVHVTGKCHYVYGHTPYAPIDYTKSNTITFTLARGVGITQIVEQLQNITRVYNLKYFSIPPLADSR